MKGVKTLTTSKAFDKNLRTAKNQTHEVKKLSQTMETLLEDKYEMNSTIGFDDKSPDVTDA